MQGLNIAANARDKESSDCLIILVVWLKGVFLFIGPLAFVKGFFEDAGIDFDHIEVGVELDTFKLVRRGDLKESAHVVDHELGLGRFVIARVGEREQGVAILLNVNFLTREPVSQKHDSHLILLIVSERQDPFFA